jgi:hypothetical protein
MTRSALFVIACVVILIAALLWTAGQAFSQTSPCAPKAAMEMQIASRFGETALPLQAMSAGNLIKWFANPQTRTWTMLAINPNGLACIAAAGDNFETSGHAAPKPGSGT